MIESVSEATPATQKLQLTSGELIRFRSSYVEADGCWEWSGSRLYHRRHRTSYGRFWLRGKTVGAHRVSFEMTHGILGPGECACHSCDNPGCVNPSHLWAGSHQENMRDRGIKGRAAFGERNAHSTMPHTIKRGEQHGSSKLTEEQVREIRSTPKFKGRRKMLADKFRVSKALIDKVTTNAVWRHIPR